MPTPYTLKGIALLGKPHRTDGHLRDGKISGIDAESPGNVENDPLLSESPPANSNTTKPPDNSDTTVTETPKDLIFKQFEDVIALLSPNLQTFYSNLITPTTTTQPNLFIILFLLFKLQSNTEKKMNVAELLKDVENDTIMTDSDRNCAAALKTYFECQGDALLNNSATLRRLLPELP